MSSILIYSPFPLKLQHWYSRVANAIYWTFSAMGYRSFVTDRKESLGNSRLTVVFSVHLWNLVRDKVALPANLCVISTEGLETEIGKHILETLPLVPQVKYVLESDKHNFAIWKQHGIEPIRFHVGYHEYFRQLYSYRHVSVTEQDIDILQFGTLTPERKALMKACEAEGWRCHHVYLFDSLCEMNVTLRRSRIVLVTHQHATRRTLDVFRLHYLATNGCFVLHEATFPGEIPEGIAEYLVTVDTEDTSPFRPWITACRHWLGVEEGERLQKASELATAFRTYLDMESQFAQERIVRKLPDYPVVAPLKYSDLPELVAVLSRPGTLSEYGWRRGIDSISGLDIPTIRVDPGNGIQLLETLYHVVRTRPARQVLLLHGGTVLPGHPDYLRISEPKWLWLEPIPHEPNRRRLFYVALDSLLRALPEGESLRRLSKERRMLQTGSRFGLVAPIEALEYLFYRYRLGDLIGFTKEEVHAGAFAHLLTLIMWREGLFPGNRLVSVWGARTM